MITKTIRSLSLILLVLIVSCTNENDLQPKVTYLPKVKHSQKTSEQQIIEIQTNQISQAGRINKTLAYDQAITAQYEGHEEMEFVFIPSNSSLDEYHVYSFKDEKLTSLHLTIKNLNNSMVITNEAGEVVVDFDNNVVKGINVTYANNATNSLARVNKCDPAQDFLDYEGAIQQQLVDSVGAAGALAVDIACSFWVVCRGAVVAAGVIYAVGNCVS